MRIRRHYYFSGRVQGVGFRYRARYAAQRHGLTGWVKNLWDERVEMEVQGEAADIAQMLAEIENSHFIEIAEIETEERPLDEHEGGFYVAGY